MTVKDSRTILRSLRAISTRGVAVFQYGAERWATDGAAAFRVSDTERLCGSVSVFAHLEIEKMFPGFMCTAIKKASARCDRGRTIICNMGEVEAAVQIGAAFFDERYVSMVPASARFCLFMGSEIHQALVKDRDHKPIAIMASLNAVYYPQIERAAERSA